MENSAFGNPIGFFTLFKREISRFLKVYIQTLVAPLLSNLLFLGIFGGVFAARDPGTSGVEYLSFLVPGLCGMGAVFAAFQNPAFSLVTQKYMNTIQDMNSYPLSAWEKVSAIVLGGTVRGVLIGVMTFIATVFFNGPPVFNPLLACGTVIAASFMFSCLGVIAGLALSNFDKINFLLSIILTPLVYFGGVFFDLAGIDGILSVLVYLNPVYPFIQLIRFAFIGTHTGVFWLNVVLVFVWSIVSYLVAFIVFKKGIGIKE